MRITQTYLGSTSHLKHTTGYPKDYPIDDAGKDTGRDPIYCPCDEMVVTAIKGYGNSKITNTLWLVSTTPVVTPTFEDICFMTLTHENDSDLKRIRVGDKFRRGSIICYEGTDGATANHVHITVGRGNSNNWEKSTTGAWVSVGDTKKPEEVFFIDRSFTTVLSSGGLPFSDLEIPKVGTPVPLDENLLQLEVLVDNLNARDMPTTSASKRGYVNRGVYTYSSVVEADNYTWYKLEDFWIAYQREWVQVFPKKEENSPDEVISLPDEIEESLKLIFQAKASKYYKIYLKENAKLYLKDS